MLRKRGFTLIELLVVISIIALLLAILMPALGKTKKMAQSVICRTNLHQWYLAMDMYTNDNNDTFWGGWWTQYVNDPKIWWMIAMRPYYNDLNKMRLCPSATRLHVLEDEVTPGPGIPPFRAWGYSNYLSTVSTERDENGNPLDYYGSYGINGWVLDAFRPDPPNEWDSNFWRKTSRFEKPYNIPFLIDAQWIDSGVSSTSLPPFTEDEDYLSPTSAMTRVLQNRHMKKENAAFMDGTARTIGLKQLWTLDWHRGFNTKGPWTKAGGVTYSHWENSAPWMASFKDY